MYLQLAHGLSDEAIVPRWVETPHVQHVCGATYFQPPRSIHLHWRKRIGEEGGEWVLINTIEAGRTAGAIEKKSVEKVIVNQ